MTKLHRLFFLLLLCLITAMPAHARVYKIATISPDGTAWMKAMRAGAAEIKKKTSGRVTFKFYPGGVMGNDENVLRKMRIGQLQGGAVTAGSLDKIHRDISIYGLPFLFSAYDQVDAARQALDKKILDGLEKKGFVSFGLAEGGFSYMMSEARLDSVDSVRGRKVWIPVGNKVGETVFRNAGISPVSLPLSDVMTGLQTGLIDTVITSPIGALALQWHTRIKHVVDVPLVYYSALLVLSKKAFDKIKDDDQKVVREVMGRVFEQIDAQNRKDNLAAREALVNQGISFNKLSADVLKQWHDIGDKAMQELKRDNGFDPGIYSSLLGFSNKQP